MNSSFSGKKEFIFGSFVYHYDLVMQDRKTLSLTVKPNLGITLKCPHDADAERIETFLKKKWFWLEKQLSFFKKYQRKIYSKEYISGESFLYLGRQYKLMVKKSGNDKITVSKGIMLVETKQGNTNGFYIKRILRDWYTKKISQIFLNRYNQMLQEYDYKARPVLAIKEMKKRWGSFLNLNTVVLNPKLINTPRECIDYVIAHELCHVKYKKHNKNFYNFLSEKFPKWEKAKERLEMIGVHDLP